MILAGVVELDAILFVLMPTFFTIKNVLIKKSQIDFNALQTLRQYLNRIVIN